MDSLSDTHWELSAEKRPWATSAVVLGAIYLVVAFWGLIYTIDPHVIPTATKISLPTQFKTIGLIFDIASIVISITFLFGGIFAKRNVKLAETALTYVPVVAVALVLLQSIYQYQMIHSEAYINYMTASLMSNPQITADMVARIMTINNEIGLVVGSVIALTELTYCVVLYIKMSAEEPRPLPVELSD